MISRERVKKAVKHQPTDRMPIDLGMHFSTGISVFAYWNLRKHLGLSTDHVEMIDCIQMLAKVDKDIIDRFHVDTILLNPSWNKTYRWNPRGEYEFHVPETFQPERKEDGGYVVNFHNQSMYMPTGGYFFDGDWPDFYDLAEDDKIALFAKEAEKIYKTTDKYTMLMGFASYFYDIEFACDMLLEPEKCKELNEKKLAEQIAYFDKVNKAMGKYINCIEVNGDLGTQNALMCTPDSYEEICYPYLKRFCEHVHNTSDIDVFLHSCGAISDAIPMIVDAGVDILNPVQISANGMDPNMLKETYGQKICFWGGGCNTQTILGKCTPDEIKSHVKDMIDIFKPNGGYVFNQVHNIMGNVPPENVVAMFDTAYENSFYEA